MGIRSLYIGFALLTAVLLGVNYARAEEAPTQSCQHGIFAEAVSDLSKDRTVVVSEVPASVIAPLVEKNGPPPETVPGFKMFRIDRLGQSALATVNPDGCIAWVSGTTASENVDRFLGIVRG